MKLSLCHCVSEHFLQEHKEELTRRVFGVHVILDALKINGIVTEKQISEIRGTNQQKMRELYRWVPSWSTESKIEMLDILRKTNRRLLFQLQGGHFVDRHEKELIEQVTEFPLNELRGYMLDEKQYESLLQCATVKTNMKTLFQIVQQWNKRWKDYLYRALAKTNRLITETLEEEHFIEKHQEELIDRVSGVNEVLCCLQYQDSPVFKDLSDRCKMRVLYTLVSKWNRKQKDHLYIVLKETNGPLIAELHEGHFVERYKEELIQRVIGAKDVAASLLHFTICTYQLDNIMQKETDKEQMETLYEMVPGWNGDWKDHLYEALKETNRDLIKELTGTRSSTQGLTPYPFAKEKCLCVREKDCSEIQPTLVLDANRTLKTYRIHIPEAGTFLCSVTDFKFEVRAAVTIEYTYSSWSQHLSEFVEPDWIVAGPVFDIHADPADVAAVHLPHFICLQGGNTDTSQMKIAHIANEGIMLEKPSHISPFHAVLENPSFSLLGVLINPIYKLFPIHSVVQLYKICKKTTTLHLYLIPNDASLIQAIKEEEEKYNSILVRKHPQTDEPLYFGSRYHIRSSAEVTVNPKELEFSYKRPEQLQSFMEIYLRNCRRINLSLKNKDNSVWDAWLEQEDLQILTTTTVKELRIKQVSYDSGTQHQEKELHFIEVHPEALIQRTVNVEGIMDMLYGNGILDLEQYQKVLSRGTNQEKMRELYQFVPSWNYSCKDQCYEALKVKNRFLIEDLEEKD
ncbi:caspase recruitment domain-containing protein 8-like isoform 2-T2 [Liasis olivaceus]